ncbi:MAG TPA: Wall-associated protein precursor [Myxococcaceae bacterium]|jgi:hypothetical protein
MDHMKVKARGPVLVLCLSAALIGLTVGCVSGAHSTVSRLADTCQPTHTCQTADASQPIYLAQISCWDTESCCILKNPATAANRCMVSPMRIAEVLNGVKTVYEATLKDEAEAKEAAEFAEAAETEGEAAPEPPDCKGQEHHVISRPIAKALKDHPNLRGLYEPRDERYKAKAKDKQSHCGYQKWHREVDVEVIIWLRRYRKASREEFEAFLREIYSRPEMRKRFPHGFGSGT